MTTKLTKLTKKIEKLIAEICEHDDNELGLWGHHALFEALLRERGSYHAIDVLMGYIFDYITNHRTGQYLYVTLLRCARFNGYRLKMNRLKKKDPTWQ